MSIKCSWKQNLLSGGNEAYRSWSHHPRCHLPGVLRRSGSLPLWTRWSDWCRRRSAAGVLGPVGTVALFPTAGQSGICWSQRLCCQMASSTSSLNTEPGTHQYFSAEVRPVRNMYRYQLCTNTIYVFTQYVFIQRFTIIKYCYTNLTHKAHNVTYTQC